MTNQMKATEQLFPVGMCMIILYGQSSDSKFETIVKKKQCTAISVVLLAF